MSTVEDKRNVLRWREEIWNKRNLNVIDELAAPGYVGHMAGNPDPVRGPEALKRFFAAYLDAFDTRVASELLISQEDVVVARDRNWVKHTRPFRGIPPTGKEVTFTSTDVYRIVEGRIAEQWFEADLTGMMRKLDILPTAAHDAPLAA